MNNELKDLRALTTRGIPDLKSFKMEPTPQWISIDTGSTGVRSAILNCVPDLSDLDIAAEMSIKDLDYTDVLAMDSAYAEIPQGLSNIPVKRTDSIYDNLDMTIENASTDTPFFRKVRIIKGSLLKHARKGAAKVAGSTGKMNQRQTYINTIAMCAITILNKSLETKTKPTFFTPIDLTLALPAEELSNEINRDLIKERLAGRYTVTFNRLNDLSFAFIITPESVHLISEAQAEAVYATKIENWELAKADRVAFIGIGGRNSGNLVMEGGVFLEGLQYTSNFGGRNLILDITNAINESLGRSITLEQGEEALTTGVITINGEEQNCLDIVNEQKKLFAQYVFQEFLNLLDRNALSVEELNYVVLCGRTLGAITEKDQMLSASLSTHFINELKSIAPKLEVKVISTNYPIPLGAMQARINLDI